MKLLKSDRKSDILTHIERQLKKKITKNTVALLTKEGIYSKIRKDKNLRPEKDKEEYSTALAELAETNLKQIELNKKIYVFADEYNQIKRELKTNGEEIQTWHAKFFTVLTTIILLWYYFASIVNQNTTASEKIFNMCVIGIIIFYLAEQIWILIFNIYDNMNFDQLIIQLQVHKIQIIATSIIIVFGFAVMLYLKKDLIEEIFNVPIILGTIATITWHILEYTKTNQKK